uniref:Uncharacterized protein n=1 Tax=Romanomermis culicivorax TaxID=13658 RepID=A0A915JKB7_ROMCU
MGLNNESGKQVGLYLRFSAEQNGTERKEIDTTLLNEREIFVPFDSAERFKLLAIGSVPSKKAKAFHANELSNLWQNYF